MKKWRYMYETFGDVWAETEEEAVGEAQRKIAEAMQTEECVPVWEGE